MGITEFMERPVEVDSMESNFIGNNPSLIRDNYGIFMVGVIQTSTGWCDRGCVRWQAGVIEYVSDDRLVC